MRAGWAPLDLARAYLSAGARLLQLRAKQLESGAFLELAHAMQEQAHAAGAQVVINDRADIAVLASSAGVHIGQEDLAPADVRRVTGRDLIIGLSTHTTGQIAHAVDQPISYLAIGPVFSTTTKATGYEAVGLEGVAAAVAHAKRAGLPVVAIGGITLATAAQVLAAGAASIAVITDLVTADPEERVRQYLSVIA